MSHYSDQFDSAIKMEFRYFSYCGAWYWSFSDIQWQIMGKMIIIAGWWEQWNIDKCYAWITENKTEKMFRQFFISITVKVSTGYPCMQYMGPILYSEFNIYFPQLFKIYRYHSTILRHENIVFPLFYFQTVFMQCGSITLFSVS